MKVLLILIGLRPKISLYLRIRKPYAFIGFGPVLSRATQVITSHSKSLILTFLNIDIFT